MTPIFEFKEVVEEVTNEHLQISLNEAKELDPDYVSLSVLAPYYGTQIWHDMEKKGKTFDKEHWEYFYHQSQDMIVNNNLDPSILREFFALDQIGRGRV